METSLDKSYWKKVSVGSQILLTDAAALEASMSQGKGMAGQEYTVKEILSINDHNNICQWLIYKITRPDQILYLSVKIVDDSVSLTMFYNPVSIIEGNRKDQIDAGNGFMFDTGNSSKYYPLQRLGYAKTINWTFDFGNGDEEVEFKQKGNMEITGRASYVPERLAKEILVATISEYLAQTECQEPEMMILEVGNPTNSDGGNILFLVGNAINEFEISIVKK